VQNKNRLPVCSPTEEIPASPHPQHFDEPLEQSQSGALPLRQPLMTAAAQPTPALTLIAPKEQFF
jgi:hypothetical protein